MSSSGATFEAAMDIQKPLAPRPISSPVTAFAGGVEPAKVTCTSRIGRALVAIGMALLAAVYVGLILLAAFGVYYHLGHNSSLLSGSGGSIVSLVVYVGPAAAGIILLFFMIKPYFAGQPKEPAKYSLTSQSDPLLFAFISRICELVKAPLPCRVDVDCEINASASFDRGLMGMRRNEVVLTIGLPLAAGLTMEEFAGVLAHEFGHFAQGAGMRLTYVIRHISMWFARGVYARAEWDLRLDEAAKRIDVRIGMILHFTRFCIWLSRRVLWVLMHIGHAISCFMLREMEYDADRYETRLAGSESFARTISKLQTLSAASQWAYRKMEESWRNRRLPENLPCFINLSTKNVPAETRRKIDEAVARKKTRIFDTHPCDADRLRAAQALNQKGIFHLREPAANLFNDFSELSKAATRFHYEHTMGLKITEQNLVPHDVAAFESQSQAEGEQSFRNYFLGVSLVFRPILIAEEVPDQSSAADLVARLKKARQAMAESKPEVQKALSEYEQAEALYQRGLDAINQSSQQATAKAATIIERLLPTLMAFEENTQIRLGCALQLLRDPNVAARIGEVGSVQKEADQLSLVFRRLGEVFVSLQELRRKSRAFMSAIDARTERRLAERADQRVAELTAELENGLNAIRPRIQSV